MIICTHTRRDIGISLSLSLSIYIYIYIFIYVCMYVCVCVWVCVNMCVYTDFILVVNVFPLKLVLTY